MLTNTKAKLQPWTVCFSAALFFFFEFIQVNMFNTITPDLMQAFQIQALETSHLSAGYFYANVILLFFAGMILDRVSTKKIIIFAMLLIVGSTIWFACTHSFWQALICHMVTGAAGAFCLLSCVRLAARWFPPKRMALVVGLIVTFAMTGGMVAQTPFTVAVDHWGWRVTLLMDALLGAAMLLIIVLVVKDFPKGAEFKMDQHRKQLQGLGFWKSLKLVALNSQNWLAGVYTSLMNLPIFVLGALWGGLYLIQIRHLTRLQASYIASWLFLGTLVGSPIIGWLSDRLTRRRLPMLVGAVLSLLLMSWLLLARQLSFVQLSSLFFLLGFITSTQILSYPLIAESNPDFLVGSAEGLAGTLIMSGGFAQTLFAILMSWGWDHQIINQVPIYSNQNYYHALVIMPVGFVIAFLAAYKLRETQAQSVVLSPSLRALAKQSSTEFL
ncbi:MAG: MFS transporter [Proteobacteria bacterium]|nr:MFS transporter [Pseudomonadota bacterium]